MPTEDFHESAKSWAQIKHGLLARYLSLFLGKTGVGRQRVYYVDAFAGPGRLRDSSKGSALYAAEIAANPRTTSRRGVLHCVNIEADEATFNMLEEATKEYVEQGSVTNLRGRFDEWRDQVLNMIGDAPALFFIDPFGTEGAELSTLAQLKRRGAIREALVRYDDTRVKRLASWAYRNQSRLDESSRRTVQAFSERTSELTSDSALVAWLNKHPDAREELIRGYVNEAKARDVFKFGIYYPLRNPDTAGHRYFLVHLCDFEDGYTWMANFMAVAERSYERSREEFTYGLGQMLLFSEELERQASDERVAEIVARMRDICAVHRWNKGQRVQNRRVLAAIVDEFGWRANRREWCRALDNLKQRGYASFSSKEDKEYIVFSFS